MEMQPLQENLAVLRRRWWLVALGVLFTLFFVFVLTLLAPRQYRTSARFLIAPVPLEDPGDLVDSTEALYRPTIAATYAEIFNSPTLQARAAEQLSVTELDTYTFSTVVLPETNILQLQVTGPDPELAMQLANGLGDQVLQYLRQFSSVYELHLLDAAPLGSAPFAARLFSNLVLGLVLGLAVGVVLALGLGPLLQSASLPSAQPRSAAAGAAGRQADGPAHQAQPRERA